MCFSATASFVASGALSALGVATLRATQRKAEIPFATIPLLFGIQQFVEGVLWLSFRFDAPQLNEAMTQFRAANGQALPIKVQSSQIDIR